MDITPQEGPEPAPKTLILEWRLVGTGVRHEISGIIMVHQALCVLLSSGHRLLRRNRQTKLCVPGLRCFLVGYELLRPPD